MTVLNAEALALAPMNPLLEISETGMPEAGGAKALPERKPEPLHEIPAAEFTALVDRLAAKTAMSPGKREGEKDE